MRFKTQKKAMMISAALLLVPNTCFAAAGAEALSVFIRDQIITQALIAFWGIAFAVLFYYSVRMIMDAYKEQAYTDISQSYINAFIGFAVIALATVFANAFGVQTLSDSNLTQVQPSVLNFGLLSVAQFMIDMSGGIFVLMIVISGIRMVTSQGEQAAFDKAKTLIGINIAGVVLMLIATAIVNGVAGVNAGIIILELKGIALFLLEVFGFLCVVALIVAGIFLIVSIDESYRDKAKNIVIGTLITLVLIFAAYGIIVTFLP